MGEKVFLQVAGRTQETRQGLAGRFFRVAGAALVAALLLTVSGAGSARAEDRLRIEVGDSPTRGPDNAPVTMFEFIDFQ